MANFINSLNDDGAAFKVRLGADGSPPAVYDTLTESVAGTSATSATVNAMYVRPRNISLMYCIKF
ncbi:hypothetical protein D3C77_746180 [compost metagenome]